MNMVISEEQIASEKKAIAKEYKELLRVSYQKLTEEDKKLIRKAFDLAVDAHKDQRRKSGEPYIFHPIAVAKIVANEIGLGGTAIAAALLHDVVEDTEITVEDIEIRFNHKVAQIVDGLTKISKVISDQEVSLQAENYRKLLLTLNEDVRVILIKIADRLHNMQTMESMASHKQAKIASETLYIYAPLAHRLGLYNIKTQLEDLGLKFTEPEEYKNIVNKIKETTEEQGEYINLIIDKINQSLEKEKITASIKGRPKSIYSIHRKMLAQKVKFEEVYDKFAIRIVYKSDNPNDEKFLAWKIYSIVTDFYKPSPSRLRDWISSPKSTGYEALHVTVMGPKGRWVEVQIRSERMDEIAEKGYAAHHKYKNNNSEESTLESWLNLLKEALESSDTLDAVEFVEGFKLNLYSKEIYVFTPKGEIKSLPKGATGLDFAFSIHTEIGIRTLGTRVNGKLVPLNHVLNSGDQVEIITSPNQKPNSQWIDYVTTSRAKNKIKNVLNENVKKIAEDGKEVLIRKLRHLKITVNEKIINDLVNFFKLKTSLDLFYRVGIGSIENQQLKDFAAQKNSSILSFFKSGIQRKTTTTDIINKQEITKNYDMLVFGVDQEKLDYKYANCCNPIPGDEVFGFLTINEGIKIHRSDCPNAISLQSNYAYRVLQAKWIDSSQEEFLASLEVLGMDSLGLTNKITKVISNHMHVDIQNISLNSNAGLFNGKISVIVQNKTILKKLIEKIKAIDGIEKVTRINN